LFGLEFPLDNLTPILNFQFGLNLTPHQSVNLRPNLGFGGVSMFSRNRSSSNAGSFHVFLGLTAESALMDFLVISIGTEQRFSIAYLLAANAPDVSLGFRIKL
jgi:hypothetical protein